MCYLYLSGEKYATRSLTTAKRQLRQMTGDDVTLECPTAGLGVADVTWNKYGGQLPVDRLEQTEFGECLLDISIFTSARMSFLFNQTSFHFFYPISVLLIYKMISVYIICLRCMLSYTHCV